MSKKLFIALGFVLILVLVVAPPYYFYNQYQKARQQLQNSSPSANVEKEKLLAQLSNLIVLPEGEEPTIATISDKEKLKGQPFFAKAKNGDKLIIYTQARKAILYDPVANKVVDMVTLNLAVATPAPVRLALYNGTKTLGLAKKAATSLEGKISNFEVVAKENASQDYTETLVIDLTGVNQDLADQLAGLLKGKVGTLPEEETKPEADILIILGTDYSPE